MKRKFLKLVEFEINLYLSSFMTNNLIMNTSSTTGATRRAGITYQSRAPKLTPDMYWESWCSIFIFLLMCFVEQCLSLLSICIVYPSTCGFWEFHGIKICCSHAQCRYLVQILISIKLKTLASFQKAQQNAIAHQKEYITQSSTNLHSTASVLKHQIRRAHFANYCK